MNNKLDSTGSGTVQLLRILSKIIRHRMEEESALAVFERKILRKMYGAVKENEFWRIRRNDELEAIIKGENIVRFMK